MSDITEQQTTIKSPEETGAYECSTCGNKVDFIGFDDRGFPGDDCECGALEEGLNCVCQVTLSQPFTVLKNGDIHYFAFTGGSFGAEIGSYTRIQCGACGAFIWRETAISPRPGSN